MPSLETSFDNQTEYLTRTHHKVFPLFAQHLISMIQIKLKGIFLDNLES